MCAGAFVGLRADKLQWCDYSRIARHCGRTTVGRAGTHNRRAHADGDR
jgi:hypothetical protein